MALTQKALAEIVTTRRTTIGTVIDANGNIATVPADTARIDYSDGEGKLLVEAASMNLAPYSACSATLGWGKGSSGTLTQLALNALGVFPGVEMASGGNLFDRIKSTPATFAVAAGATYVVSFYYQAGTSGNGRFQVAIDDGSSSDWRGVIGALASSATGAGTLTLISDAVVFGSTRRAVFTWVPNASGAGSVEMGPYSTTSGQTLIALGAQVEVGTVPTSYIPTNGGAVTRASDFCTVDVSALGISSAMTIAMKGNLRGVINGFERLYQLDNGLGSERITAFYSLSGGQIRAQAFAGDANIVGGVAAANYTLGADFAIAYRIGGGAARMSFNGVLQGEGALSQPYTPPNFLRIGSDTGVPAKRLLVKSILIYPVLLSDAALTALGTV